MHLQCTTATCASLHRRAVHQQPEEEAITPSAETTIALISFVDEIQASQAGSRLLPGAACISAGVQLGSTAALSVLPALVHGGKAEDKHGKGLTMAEHEQSGALRSTKTSPKRCYNSGNKPPFPHEHH